MAENKWPWPKVIGVCVGIPVVTYVGLDTVTGGQVTKLVKAPIDCLKSLDVNNLTCVTKPIDNLLPPASTTGKGSGDLIALADEVKELMNDVPRSLGLLYHGLVNNLTDIVNMVPGVQATPLQVETALPYVAAAAVISIGLLGLRRMNIAANRYR